MSNSADKESSLCLTSKLALPIGHVQSGERARAAGAAAAESQTDTGRSVADRNGRRGSVKALVGAGFAVVVFLAHRLVNLPRFGAPTSSK